MDRFGRQYNTGKLIGSFSISGDFGKGKLFSDTKNKDLLSSVGYNTQSVDTMFDKNCSANANLFYKINDRNNISFNSNYVLWSKNEYINENTNISNSATSIVQSKANREDKQKMQIYGLALNYNLLLDSAGTDKLMLLANFDKQYCYNSDSYNDFYNFDKQANLLSQEGFWNRQKSPYHIIATELRYINNFQDAGTMTTGVKYSLSNIYNSLSVFDRTGQMWQQEENSGYDFHYKEQLVSYFIQYNLQRKKWNLLAGVRAEYDAGEVMNVTPKDEDFNLFPSVFFDYNLTQSQMLGISYSHRIQRVNYLRLIPNRYFLSQYNIIQGNPELKPDIQHNLELNYSISDTYSFTLGYHWSNNMLSRYSTSETIDNRSLIVDTYKDGVKNKNLNFNVYIPVTITKWWNTINQFNADYDYYISENPDYGTFSCNFFTNHTFQLFWKIKADLLYRFFSSSKTAYNESNPYHLLNLSLQRSFLSDKLNIKVAAERLIVGQKMISKTATLTAEAINEMYHKKAPYLSVTLSYSFGKGKTQRMPRIENSNVQEKNRTY